MDEKTISRGTASDGVFVATLFAVLMSFFLGIFQWILPLQGWTPIILLGITTIVINFFSNTFPFKGQSICIGFATGMTIAVMIIFHPPFADLIGIWLIFWLAETLTEPLRIRRLKKLGYTEVEEPAT